MNQNVFNANSIHQMVACNGPAQHTDACCSSPAYREASFSRETFLFPPIHPAFGGGIESYLDPKYATDPIAFASRLPYLPFHATYGMYEFGFEPAFIRKRNERERQRVKCVNDGYAKLRDHLPQEFAEKRLSKVETLRGAIQYIKHLQGILGIEKKVENLRQQKRDQKNNGSPSSSENEQDANDAEEGEEDKELIETTEPLEQKESSKLFQNQKSSISKNNNDKTNYTSQTKIKLEALSPTATTPRKGSTPSNAMYQKQSNPVLKHRHSSAQCIKNATSYSNPKFQDDLQTEYLSCSYGKIGSYATTDFKRAKINTNQSFQQQYPYNTNNMPKRVFEETNETPSQLLHNSCCAYNSVQNPRCSMNFHETDGSSQYDSMMQNRRDFLSSYYYQNNQSLKNVSASTHMHDNNGGFNAFRHFAKPRGCYGYEKVEVDSDGFKSDSSPCSNGIATSP